MSRILGVDFGSRKVGFAIGDTESKIAFPRKVFYYQENKELLKEIENLIDQEDIEVIVWGLPLNMKGERTAQTDMTTTFATKIKSLLKIKTVFQDERLSTKEAQNLFQEKETAGEDSLAAQIILQNYFDKHQ